MDIDVPGQWSCSIRLFLFVTDCFVFLIQRGVIGNENFSICIRLILFLSGTLQRHGILTKHQRCSCHGRSGKWLRPLVKQSTVPIDSLMTGILRLNKVRAIALILSRIFHEGVELWLIDCRPERPRLVIESINMLLLINKFWSHLIIHVLVRINRYFNFIIDVNLLIIIIFSVLISLERLITILIPSYVMRQWRTRIIGYGRSRPTLRSIR